MKPLDAGADCWVDGMRQPVRDARVPIDDPAFQAGLGLFETIAIRKGRPLDLELHLARLASGAQQMGIELPAVEVLRAVAREAANDGAELHGWLKIIVTGGGHSFVMRGAMDAADEGRPASAILLPWRRNLDDPLVGLKTLNYAANRMGLEMAQARGADEGLWLNTRGHLAEGCRSNLFVMHGGRLFTPGMREGILPGVVRGRVLTAARALGLAVHETRVRVPRLRRAAEAFLTSSLRGVRPLVRFERAAVGTGRPGAVTCRIAEEVARLRMAGGP
jgi:branched-subunit amino acid aminotransferase/4-amino-4-deoxychorismate lyase